MNGIFTDGLTDAFMDGYTIFIYGSLSSTFKFFNFMGLVGNFMGQVKNLMAHVGNFTTLWKSGIIRQINSKNITFT